MEYLICKTCKKMNPKYAIEDAYENIYCNQVSCLKALNIPIYYDKIGRIRIIFNKNKKEIKD